jgi:hypothetical protein
MFRLLAAALAALILSACGGGGGAAPAGLPSGAMQRPASSVPDMPAPLRAALEKAIPVRQALAAGGPLTSAEALDWAEQNHPNLFVTTGKQQGFYSPYTYRFYPQTNSYLGVATASDDVAVFFFSALNGWQMQRLGALTDFTCQIKPAACVLGADPPTLGMEAFEGHTVTQAIDAVVPAIPGTLTAQVGPTPPASWMSVSLTGTSTVKVTANTAGLATGDYQGSVLLKFQPASGTASTRLVPVSFTIGPGLIAPAAVQRTLDANATLASLGGSVDVTRGDGAAQGWTANSSASWLKLGATSGTTPAKLNYSIDSGAVAALANFADHIATVTIASTGVTPVSFQVTLAKRLPYLQTAMPYGVPAGAPSRIVVFGKGLSQIGGTPKITGLTASSIEVQSDTQLVFKATPASAGSYSVRVGNAANVTTDAAVLRVAAANPYTAGSFPVAGRRSTVAIHDPVRQAVFAVSYKDNAVYKYQHSNGNWTISAVPVSSWPDALVLSPDGSRLWVTQVLAGTVKEIDPDTMQVVATHTSPTTISNNYETPLAISIDSRLWIPGSYFSGHMVYLDLADRTFRQLAGGGNVESAGYVGSADGSIVMVSPDFCCTPRRPWHLYKSADATVTNPMGSLDLWYRMRLSADGQRILQQGTGEIYSGSFELTGQLPDLPSGEYYGRMDLTPDGTRLLAMVYEGSYSATFKRLDVFSTSALGAGTTRFLKTGSVPVTEQASECSNSDYDCHTFGYLLPAADSKTVFWLGNARLLTFKLP